MKKAAAPVILLALSALLHLVRGNETPQYTVVHSESEFEIRLYRQSAWMSAPSDDISFEKATKHGFHRSIIAIICELCNVEVEKLKSNKYKELLLLTSDAHNEEYKFFIGCGSNEVALVAEYRHRGSKLNWFWLFQYIQGANLNFSRIAMTFPVLTSIVPNAGPLHSSAYFVRLYLPVKFQASPPVPLPELNLHPDRWASQCVAVRKFSGFARDGNVVKEAEKLAISLSLSPWANSTDFTGNSAYSIAQYNSPFRIIGRVNEVWADVIGSSCESGSIATY